MHDLSNKTSPTADECGRHAQVGAAARAGTGNLRLILESQAGYFPLDLEWKDAQMGHANIRQFWMDLRTLYPAAGEKAGNGRSIVEYFWDLCRRADTRSSRAVQESFLLMSLLPLTRRQGTQRVIADARFGPEQSKAYAKQRGRAIADLEAILNSGTPTLNTMRVFCDRTGAALRSSVISAEVEAQYASFTAELFHAPCGIVEHDPDGAVELLRERWRRAMKNWGRHRGHDVQKRVLDILSYESRAAFHRAYSAVWTDLLADLHHAFNLSAEDLRFIQLWHLDRCSRHEAGVPRFHLFHGHVFGLHPATALLAQTRTGRRLIGDFLLASTPELQLEPFQRLLYGIELAVHVYLQYRADIADGRRRRPNTIDMSEIAATDD